MNSVADAPSVIAIEATAGFAAGGQPSDSETSEFGQWSARVVALGADSPIVGPLRLGGNLRYEAVRFDALSAPRARVVRLTGYAGLVWCRDCLFQHGPRLGLGVYSGVMTSQGARARQDDYKAVALSLEYWLGIRVVRRLTVVSGVGVSVAEQTGFNNSPAIQIQWVAGLRFDL